ncbi:MAG: acetate--CoA ligase family protein [Betaproteobacteria bacterium]
MKTPLEIIQSAKKEGRKALFENEAKELVRSVGVIVPRSVVVDPQKEQDILAAGEKLGFPLALKAVSAEVLHKTEAGAVILDIKDNTSLAAAVKHMKATVPARVPGAVIRSFLLEKMMPSGLELLIGGLRDEQFGPSVSFGLGGIWVEALRDAVFGILPMTREEMLDMISETRASVFLKGFRNSPPLDQEAVLGVIAAVSKLMTDYPGIKEIDLNPVRVYAKSAAALDVRVILA